MKNISMKKIKKKKKSENKSKKKLNRNKQKLIGSNRNSLDNVRSDEELWDEVKLYFSKLAGKRIDENIEVDLKK